MSKKLDINNLDMKEIGIYGLALIGLFAFTSTFFGSNEKPKVEITPETKIEKQLAEIATSLKVIEGQLKAQQARPKTKLTTKEFRAKSQAKLNEYKNKSANKNAKYCLKMTSSDPFSEPSYLYVMAEKGNYYSYSFNGKEAHGSMYINDLKSDKRFTEIPCSMMKD